MGTSIYQTSKLLSISLSRRIVVQTSTLLFINKNHCLENGNDKRLFRLPEDNRTPGFDDQLDSTLNPTSAAFQSRVQETFGSSNEICYRDPIVIDNSNIYMNTKILFFSTTFVTISSS